ncbi:MAG: gamma-glutamyltransferase [Trueperaceae bacterium]|nr:gamma-glutamyltransferase [Trueperaceae bacterium]MCO5173574.1 gamma-glutamyltransferase [Trueperaceae bacterium]MCW5818562.1 gamma-glutamyltransferase [Trueperaceae bacterium]
MKGIVVAPQPVAVELGAKVLEDGGNAFDAVIAAAFVQMVSDPFMCGLGGWGSGVFYRAETDTFENIGFWARIGSKMRPDMWEKDVKGFTDIWRFALFDDHRNLYGYTSIMTPGTVAGFAEVHRRYATKPWAELLRPSIELSENGFHVPEYMAQHYRQLFLPGLPHPRDKYAHNPAARALFRNSDESDLKERGEFYSNPDQARVLRRLAEAGPEDFYTGEIAEVIANDFEANGAFVTREDLASYRPVVEPALDSTYRGYDVVSTALPGGGLLLLQILNILEQFDLSSMEHNGPEHAFIVGGALAWAGVTRGRHLADPAYRDVPVAELLSKEYAADIAERIRRSELPTEVQLNRPGYTTHISVMDELGNCASITHTLTTCAGIVVPGTGFTWNNCVSLMDPIPGRPNSYEPGKARASAIAATIVMREGRPWIVLGAPGGWSVTSAVAQSISNIIDFGMSPVEAAAAARFHSEGNPVYCEGRVSARTVAALRGRGMTVEQSLMNFENKFGSIQIAMHDENGFRGGSDPRRDGGTFAVAHG